MARKTLIAKQVGFTLIELMIVVAIIGILAAIAVPQFAAYRQKSFNAVAESDLRTVMLAEATYFIGPSAYIAVPSAMGPGQIAALPGSAISNNVGYTVNAPNPIIGFAAFTGHRRGTRVFAGDYTSVMQWRNPPVGQDPAAAAVAEATLPPVPAAWGNQL